MNGPIEMDCNSDENADWFPSDNRSKCVKKVDAILLFKTTSHKAGFVACGTAINTGFNFVYPSR